MPKKYDVLLTYRYPSGERLRLDVGQEEFQVFKGTTLVGATQQLLAQHPHLGPYNIVSAAHADLGTESWVEYSQASKYEIRRYIDSLPLPTGVEEPVDLDYRFSTYEIYAPCPRCSHNMGGHIYTMFSTQKINILGRYLDDISQVRCFQCGSLIGEQLQRQKEHVDSLDRIVELRTQSLRDQVDHWKGKYYDLAGKQGSVTEEDAGLLLHHLGLSTRGYNALIRSALWAGYDRRTLQPLEESTANKLLEIKNFGEIMLEELRIAMAKHGKHLLGEEETVE